ncbi:MAG: toll/interleukin-1 receptor domain-containing protein [Anaerolineae bacterium]|nr:toll/interleukin-1 receptor domain-containing protein [Anaerolineae bacterium]
MDKGLNNSDTVLLVVSKASLASKYVTLEWQHFLETNKRVILLIFEAVDLPKELEKYEWVDFRGSYKAGLQELFSQLKQPIREEHPVPETVFKAPLIVWFTIAVSVVTAICTLPLLWTLFLPWILIPLPYRIFKRSFNFAQVQAALLMLPFSLFFEAVITESETNNLDRLIVYIFISVIAGLLLFFVLRSPALQRWGKPEANMRKFANPYKPDDLAPAPVSFFVDYAIQDRHAAEDLIAALKAHRHILTQDIHSAKAVFVLISRFKSDTEADPEKQVVYPVLIQTNPNLAEKLSKLQWIDFRPGVRKLDVIAKLLPEPSKLLKALGMRPVSSQTVYSPIITTMYYFLIFLGAFTIGSSYKYFETSQDALLSLSDNMFGNVFFGLIFHGIVFLVLLYLMLRGITRRTGWFSSFKWVVAGFFGIGILTLWQFSLSLDADSELQAAGNNLQTSVASFLPFLIYFLGITAMAFFFFLNRRDIQRWFPVKK